MPLQPSSSPASGSRWSKAFRAHAAGSSLAGLSTSLGEQRDQVRQRRSERTTHRLTSAMPCGAGARRRLSRSSACWPRSWSELSRSTRPTLGTPSRRVWRARGRWEREGRGRLFRPSSPEHGGDPCGEGSRPLLVSQTLLPPPKNHPDLALHYLERMAVHGGNGADDVLAHGLAVCRSRLAPALKELVEAGMVTYAISPSCPSTR